MQDKVNQFFRTIPVAKAVLLAVVFFHERDFGDKTKSLLSPLVTGSKSSSVSAQEVS